MDIDVERARWRSTLNYRILRTLQLGVEFNPGEEEVGPLVSWFLLTERHGVPAVFLGTSSDRIGSPAGEQSYYATVAKASPWFPASAYVTLNYSEWDEGLNVPFGGTISIGRGVTLRGMYDGQKSHVLSSLVVNRVGFSIMSVWLERLGISIALGF